MVGPDSIELIRSPFGDDQMVVNVARVSFDKWLAPDDSIEDRDIRLINYLAKNGHKSPFYHPKLQVRVTVPFFVANQMKRHHIGFDLNEVSRRYVDDQPRFYEPEEWRARPERSIKQGSGLDSISELTMSDRGTGRVWQLPISDAYKNFINECLSLYESMLASNVAPEMARLVLPQSTYTSWVWTGSLYGYANFCWQRLDSHAQSEVREVAQQLNDIIEPLFPASWAALMKYKPVYSEG